MANCSLSHPEYHVELGLSITVISIILLIIFLVFVDAEEPHFVEGRELGEEDEGQADKV